MADWRVDEVDRARDLLVLVGLEECIGYRTARLSAGQTQRVCHVRALMNHPEPVLADEPTGSPDKVSAQQVMELIAQISQAERTTNLISTHDDAVAAKCRREIRVETAW